MSLFLTFITSLMLGMRHATDPDHIVAVTTIVTRERSVVKAAGIGALWGVGHTITLLATAHIPSLQRSLRFASGAVSLVFGLYLAHRIGFGDGLFTSDPRWTPR
ncbi:MAG TPA: hypothetical protein VF858_03840 [Gemmatimonadaceae bacterium]